MSLEILAELRAQAHTLQQRVAHDVLGLSGVIVSAKPEPGSCVICQGEMKVQKTFQHGGKTIQHGTFQVCETVLVCAAGCRHPCGERVTQRAQEVVDAIMPNRVVGYDVMVFVGRQRFLEHRQREEIRTRLEREYGLRLSSGEVSRLAWLFVQYFARLHRARADRLKAALESDGGWPMHVDATGEDGRGTMFMVMAGWRQWVLGAWKLSTERAELILPCLREIVRRFGVPCAAMRDLGRAVTPALDDLFAELKRDIPVLACHQHFLADIGKDLLKPAHGELRDLFRRTKVRPRLRGLVRDLGRRLGESITETHEAVRAWQSLADAGHCLPQGRDGLAIVRALAQWTLDYQADATGLDFPFDRPYLDLYERSMTAMRAVEAFLRNPPDDRKVVGALERLHRVLGPVACEVPFRLITRRLRRRAALFDELRRTLRLTAKPCDAETEQELGEMRNQLDALVSSLEERRPERGPAQDTRKAIDLILEHLDKHGEHLWGHAILLHENAGVRLVARTNSLVENFFKDMKHGERRRSGRKNLTQDLEHLPAEAALVYNLERADYVSLVCGSLDRLPEAFALIDCEERERNKNGESSSAQENLGAVLQIASASLSTEDRRVVRTEEMNRRIYNAARSQAPRCQI